MPIAIALADDSLIVREGIARILAGEPNVRVVASCGDLPSEVMSVPVRGGRVVIYRRDHTNSSTGNESVTWKAVVEHRVFGFPVEKKTLVDWDRESLDLRAVNDSTVQLSMGGILTGGNRWRTFTIPR